MVYKIARVTDRNRISQRLSNTIGPGAFFNLAGFSIDESEMSPKWPPLKNTPGFWHDADGYTLALEVPGYTKESIEVRVDPVNRLLGLRVTNYKKNEDVPELPDEGEVVLQHTVPIPGGANISEDPKAKLDLGILTITFSEDVATQPRIVEVTVE